MGKFDRFVRLPILELLNNKPDKVIVVKGHYSGQNEFMTTFHKVTCGKHVLSGHVNLPKHLIQLPEGLSKDASIAFNALPDCYNQKGIIRGSFKPLKDEAKIIVRKL